MTVGAPTLRMGTSGWIYRHWRGLFYPEGLPQRSWFDFYSQHFDTVEINFTFYRLPTREVFERWRERSAPDFRYAVKGSRFLTHLRRLREPEEAVERLADRLQGIGDRCGPILWQLPPDFARDDERLADFLAVLPTRWRHTIEFRHESWLVAPVFDRIARHGVALCVADHPQLPQSVELTAGWTYVRFHAGHRDGEYTAEQIDAWAERIAGWLARGVSVWVYFNNDWGGHAIRNALQLRERLVGGRQQTGHALTA